MCGTCLTGVIEGEPDHKDVYLTPEEQEKNDQFLPCCSRSKSPMWYWTSSAEFGRADVLRATA